VDSDKDGTRNVTDAFLRNAGISLSGLPPESERELEFELLADQNSKPLSGDAQIFQDTLAKIGIKVKLTLVPSNALWASLLRGQYQAARVDFISDGDPNKITDIYHSRGRLHIWKYSDAQGQGVAEWQRNVDGFLSKQKTAAERERWDMLCKFQEAVAEDVPLIFLYNVSDIQAYRKDLIGNFKGLEGNFGIRHSEYLYLRPRP
jgi:ABC-type transport system substrate-binding protein